MLAISQTLPTRTLTCAPTCPAIATAASFDDANLPIAAESSRMREAEPEISTTRSEEHTSELQSLMRISYAVFCLKKKKKKQMSNIYTNTTSSETQNNNTHYIITIKNITTKIITN